MPIPEQAEPDTPHMDLRMLEFVERRRAEQARARRQQIQLVAIIGLGLIGIILAVSNAVLVSRLGARPVIPPTVAPPPAHSASPAPPATSSTDSSAPTTEPMAPSAAVRTGPKGSPSEADVATRPAPTSPPSAPSSSIAPQPRSVGDEPPALPERSPRAPRSSVPRESQRSMAVRESPPPSPPRESASLAVDVDPALRTARWMLHTYGPLDAEAKALAAAQFYSGDEGEFWRRVVAHVRAER